MPSVADNPARICEVADAIAAELNATIAVVNESDDTTISPARFTAQRTYGEDYQNSELKTLQVDVRPPAWAMDVEARGEPSGKPSGEDNYQIEIAVQQMVDQSDQDAIDLLVDLTARIARYFCVGKRLGDYEEVDADTVLVIETLPQLYAPDKLKQGRYFGMVTLVLKEFVDR